MTIIDCVYDNNFFLNEFRVKLSKYLKYIFTLIYLNYFKYFFMLEKIYFKNIFI